MGFAVSLLRSRFSLYFLNGFNKINSFDVGKLVIHIPTLLLKCNHPVVTQNSKALGDVCFSNLHFFLTRSVTVISPSLKRKSSSIRFTLAKGWRKSTTFWYLSVIFKTMISQQKAVILIVDLLQKSV